MLIKTLLLIFFFSFIICVYKTLIWRNDVILFFGLEIKNLTTYTWQFVSTLCMHPFEYTCRIAFFSIVHTMCLDTRKISSVNAVSNIPRFDGCVLYIHNTLLNHAKGYQTHSIGDILKWYRILFESSSRSIYIRRQLRRRENDIYYIILIYEFQKR